MHSPSWFIAACTLFFALYLLTLLSNGVKASLMKRRLTKWSRDAIDLVPPHVRELRAKRSSLTIDKGYGVLDDSPWQEELNNFVYLVLLGGRKRRIRDTARQQEYVAFSTRLVRSIVERSGDPSDIANTVIRRSLPRTGGMDSVEWVFALAFVIAAVLMLFDHARLAGAAALSAGALVAPAVKKELQRVAPWFTRYSLHLGLAMALAVVSTTVILVQQVQRQAEREQIRVAQEVRAKLEAEQLAQRKHEAEEADRKWREEALKESQLKFREEVEAEFAQNRDKILGNLAAAIQEGRLSQALLIISRFDSIDNEAKSKLVAEYKQKVNAAEQREIRERVQAAKEEAQRERLENYERRIRSYAIDAYTAKSYPQTYKKYRLRLPEIEKMRRAAAEMAIDSGKCDYVENVQLSDKSSPTALVFFIDCENRARIFLTEDDIASGATVNTQEELSWDHPTATMECREMIRRRAEIPSSVDFHTLTGTSVRTVLGSGNVVVRLDFDAKNTYGAEIGFTGQCIFAPGKPGELKVFLRE